MPAPNSQRQHIAQRILKQLFADAENVSVIHYSCEGFTDLPDGRSPRITSIAVRRLSSGQTESFSIHQVAEERDIPFAAINAEYKTIERDLLARFYDLVRSQRNMKYLHWNMRDTMFGFAALEHRFRALQGTPEEIREERRIDLSRLLVDIYGREYAGHPRLKSLMDMNFTLHRDLLTGEEEAAAFRDGAYFKLHASTLRKVLVLAHIARLAADGQLRTNSTWWTMHGGSAREIVNWIVYNKLIAFLIAVLSLTIGIAGIYLTN
jgi:hypothetical protein